MNQRHAAILDRLAGHGHATVRDLSRLTGVSVVTVRHDLDALEREGFIRRVHGGAALLETDNIARRLGIRHEQKLAIARLAATLVEDGETVLIESGSANALLARQLAPRRVQIVAANLFVARQVRAGDQARVAVLGGFFQPDSESLVGALARKGIAETNFAKAFLGMDGFTPETGFTNQDMMRAEIGAAVAAKRTACYVVADSSKFGHTAMSRTCGLEDLAGVITNRDLASEFVSVIRSSPAELYLA